MGGRCERRRRSDVLRIGSARDEEDLRFYLPHLDRKAPKSEVATTLSLTGRRGPGAASAASATVSDFIREEMSSSEPLPDMDTTPAVDCDGLLDRGSGRTVITMSGTPLDEESSSESHNGWVVATRRSRSTKKILQAPSQQAKQTGKRSSSSQPTRAQFAQKLNVAFSKAARMPNMPIGEHKVVVRPRGGLLLRKRAPAPLTDSEDERFQQEEDITDPASPSSGGFDYETRIRQINARLVKHDREIGSPHRTGGRPEDQSRERIC
ncbi:hypothetical protein MRX96_030135 [Rhipicephalus microplus]